MAQLSASTVARGPYAQHVHFYFGIHFIISWNLMLFIILIQLMMGVVPLPAVVGTPQIQMRTEENHTTLVS